MDREKERKKRASKSSVRHSSDFHALENRQIDKYLDNRVVRGAAKTRLATADWRAETGGPIRLLLAELSALRGIYRR